jgi:hypothetical protein
MMKEVATSFILKGARMRQVFRLAALPYEVRVITPFLFALPVIVTIALGGLAGILDIRHSVTQHYVSDLFVATVEACLPLAAGIALASLAARDSAVELLLTLPISYRAIAFRRFTLVVCWMGFVGLATTLALHIALPWALPKTLSEQQLIWLAPLLWLGSFGALIALLLRSTAIAGTLLGLLWIIQLAFHGFFEANGWTRPWYLFVTINVPNASYWLANRLELIGTALVVAVVVWIYLRNAEWRLRSEEK